MEHERITSLDLKDPRPRRAKIRLRAMATFRDGEVSRRQIGTQLDQLPGGFRALSRDERLGDRASLAHDRVWTADAGDARRVLLCAIA